MKRKLLPTTPLSPLCLGAALSVLTPAAHGSPLTLLDFPDPPPLPEPVTSFGAVTVDGWLYVFGGHKGERHQYTADQVSGSFHRLRLQKGSSWERLPAATPGQGQPLAAHDGWIYRTGGMAARNAEGEPQALYSLAVAQRFNPRSNRWEDLPPLPQPRSSHDAVVIGDRLYLAGGWSVAGKTKEALWHTNALMLDLKQPEAGWTELPQPFQRRALALATIDSRVAVIGGMDSDNSPTLAVEWLDTTTGQWSRGPDLPDGKNKGFGCSAITQAGRLFVSPAQGDLLRLSTDGRTWEVVGRLEHPRMAHRLVTAGTSQLIALGGDDSEGKLPDLELLTPAQQRLAVSQVPASTPATGTSSSN